jgi:hypothetical protein
MSAVWLVVGAAVIAFGIYDLFLTVLHYEDPGLVTLRTYSAAWKGARWATKPLPRRARAFTRSMVAPALVVVQISLWLGLQVVGFALLYYPAISSHHFVVGRTGHSFGTALYFSAASLTSLSFSDVEPRSLAYHSVAAAETLVGLGILTLTISYLLNLYRVLQDQGVLSSLLLHHSATENDPTALLRPHFVDGRPTELGTLLRELDRSLTEFGEGIRRYPLVWYFHTRRAYRSLPYIFWFAGAAAGAVRWGLPATHPATTDPWLAGLISGYEDMVGRVSGQFLGAPAQPGAALTFTEFRDAVGRGEGGGMVTRFLEVEQRMCEMGATEPEHDLGARFERYRDWVRFAGMGGAFVRRASTSLGLDPQLLFDDPRGARF